MTLSGTHELVFSRPYAWAGYLLGLSLGGFFDGILLHQILQWHSLLSSLEGEIYRNLRFQILADGVFHALMYFMAATGLVLLWRTRREFSAPHADRRFLANLLIGFGAWHIADAIINHWILGLHRIREASENVLLWDLVFFALGIVLVGIGLALRRDKRLQASLHTAKAGLVALLVMTAGVAAAVPWENTKAVTVVFRTGVTPAEVFAAAGAVDGRLMWSNEAGDVWVFQVSDNRRAWRLYDHGALFVGGSFFGVGCFTSNSSA